MGDAADVAAEVVALGAAADAAAAGAALTAGLAEVGLAAGLAAAGVAEADLPLFAVEDAALLTLPAVWFDPDPALPGRKASMRRSAIEKPVCSSGASDKSGRLVIAIW